MQIVKAITTEIGILQGRDCIFLDAVAFDGGTLVLTGEITGSHVKPKNAACTGKWLPYSLRFSGILALRMVELDSFNMSLTESSFDEIFDSQWSAALGGKVKTSHHHYCVQTYDNVFEVVCDGYELTLGDPQVPVEYIDDIEEP